MDLYLIVLRIFHIVAGVFWAGGAFALVGFISPAATQAGPAGGKFMQRLTLGTRWIMTVSAAAGVSVLTGVLLYWRASGGLRPEWITTGTGIAFTVGGLAALIALFVGVQVAGNSRKLAELGQRIEAAGGPPSPQDASQLAALQARLQTLGTVTATLLVITLLTMASARYLSF